MSREDRYGILIDAERSAEIQPANAERGWDRLQGALHRGRSPLPISALPLSFGAVLFTTKAAAMAVALGAAAAGAGWVYRAELGLTAPSAPSISAANSSTGIALSGASHHASRPPAPELMAEASSAPAQPAPTADAPASHAAPTQPAYTPAPSAVANTPSELNLIGSAKRDVDRGSPALARHWLREHARLYPHGALQFEREALTVIATCSESREPSAQSAARAYLRRYPHSIYQDRVKRACHVVSREGSLEPTKVGPRPAALGAAAVDTASQPAKVPGDAPSEASFPSIEP